MLKHYDSTLILRAVLNIDTQTHTCTDCGVVLTGKGRGRQVIAVARTADLVVMMLDATKNEVQRSASSHPCRNKHVFAITNYIFIELQKVTQRNIKGKI